MAPASARTFGSDRPIRVEGGLVCFQVYRATRVVRAQREAAAIVRELTRDERIRAREEELDDVHRAALRGRHERGFAEGVVLSWDRNPGE